MHPLLIQQLVIDEATKLVQAQGVKPLKEAKFDSSLLVVILQPHGINSNEAYKWIAYMHIEGYIELTTQDPIRNPVLITLTPKGMGVETSKYFIEKYNEKRKGSWKYWVDICAQIIIGGTAIIALIVSSATCNKDRKEPKCKEQSPSINKYNTIPGTKSFSSLPENKPLHVDTTKTLSPK